MSASRHNPDLGIYLAAGEQGTTLTCPACSHSGPASEFGTSGTSTPAKPEILRTPAPGTGSVRQGVPLTVKAGKAPHSLANTGSGISLAAAATARHPVKSPLDVIVARGETGGAVIRHRQGGAEIAKIRNDGGKWVASVGGKDLAPHEHQRTALLEAVGTYNKAVQAGGRTQSAPLQPDPVQSPLMEQFGVPASRSAGFATPTAGAGDGPRVTVAAGTDTGTSGGGGGGASGLGPKAQAVYKKLIARGFPPARAMAFAKNAERFAAKAAA